MDILISIKPKFAREIFNGTKKYEFRKRWTKKDVEKCIVHVCGVGTVGEFEIESILIDTPKKIFEKTWLEGEIDFNDFTKYFFGKNIAHAIKIKNPILYSEVIKTKNIPQSFRFIR